MTSTIFIRDKVIWMPKQWILEIILSSIRDEASILHYHLLVEKLDNAIEVGMGTSFEDLGEDNFQNLSLVTDKTFQSMKAKDIKSIPFVDNNDEFLEVLLVFLQFRTLLQIDPRMMGIGDEATIVIDKLGRWKNKKWICDLIVCGLDIIARSKKWTGKLTTKDKGKLILYELPLITPVDYSLLLQSVEYLSKYFDGTRYIAVADEIQHVLPSAIEAFNSFVKSQEIEW